MCTHVHSYLRKTHILAHKHMCLHSAHNPLHTSPCIHGGAHAAHTCICLHTSAHELIYHYAHTAPQMYAQHGRPPILRYSEEYLAGTTPYSRYPSPSLITCPGLCCSLNSSHSLELSQPHVATLRLWTLVTGMISKPQKSWRRGRLRG